MLDIRYVVGVMLASVALLIICFRLFGASNAPLGMIIGGKPAYEFPAALQPSSQRIAAPIRTPGAETTGSIGKTRSNEASRAKKPAKIEAPQRKGGEIATVPPAEPAEPAATAKPAATAAAPAAASAEPPAEAKPPAKTTARTAKARPAARPAETSGNDNPLSSFSSQ
jgi:hypothetical protein